MDTGRHLLYISDVPPGPGLGGRIIADRHLRRLAAEGWHIIVVVPFGQTPAPGPWRSIQLPARRWWWPPFRPSVPWLARLRLWAWRRELADRGVTRCDRIVTVCWGPMSWLAASLAESLHAPLIAIVHDWWGEIDNSDAGRIGRHTCRIARTVLAVSTEMQEALRQECEREVDLLYPVPADRSLPFAAWREVYVRPVVAHVGSLQAHHEDFLAELAAQLRQSGGQLLLLCPSDNPTAAALAHRCSNLIRQDLFPDNQTALSWIAEHASALVVMYPLGRTHQGRAPTGFPSRLVEFSQTGLPILLAAPTGNPISSWAQRHNWTGWCDPTDRVALRRWVESLTDQAAWTARATDTRRAAMTDFDPERLHAQLSSALASP